MVNIIGNDEHFILISLLITVCMQMSFFAIAYTLQIDKVTDFAGTANFLVLAVFTIWLGGDFSFPKILASVMVILWSLRLGIYLTYRIMVWGEDNRFDELRSKFWSFLGFWVYQILWVFLTSLPVIYFNSLDSPSELNTIAIIGAVMFGIGFIIEAWADTLNLMTNYTRKKGVPMGVGNLVGLRIILGIFYYGSVFSSSALHTMFLYGQS